MSERFNVTPEQMAEERHGLLIDLDSIFFDEEVIESSEPIYNLYRLLKHNAIVDIKGYLRMCFQDDKRLASRLDEVALLVGLDRNYGPGDVGKAIDEIQGRIGGGIGNE